MNKILFLFLLAVFGLMAWIPSLALNAMASSYTYIASGSNGFNIRVGNSPDKYGNGLMHCDFVRDINKKGSYQDGVKYYSDTYDYGYEDKGAWVCMKPDDN